MDDMTKWTAMMVIHYTQQNNGRLETQVTLEHVMEWIETYNRKPVSKIPTKVVITSEELI